MYVLRGTCRQISLMLIFKGDCQNAIQLYERAFKTEVSEITRSDILQIPDNPYEISNSQKNWIVMATMNFGDNFIRLSDTIRELNDTATQRISIAMETTVNEAKHAFSVLAKEGNIGIPLQESFFNPCYGAIVDKFGVMWTVVGRKK